MKKCIAVLLFSALLLCFSACMAASVPGEEGSPQMEDKSPAAEEELAFSLGRVEGNTYENEFLGIGCTLDSSWTFFSQEELSALNNAAEDMLPADFTESAAEAEQLYAMYALGENQMDVISINLEKADNEIIEKLDLRENYEKAAALLMDGYEQLGYTDVSYEIGSVNLGGESFPSLRTSMRVNDILLFQEAVSMKCPGYIANLMFTAQEEETIDSLIGKFYLLR